MWVRATSLKSVPRVPSEVGFESGPHSFMLDGGGEKMTEDDEVAIKLMIGEAILEERRKIVQYVDSGARSPSSTFLSDIKDVRRQECIESNQIPCGYCGRPSGTPRGVTHMGKMRCSSCRSKQMRVRG